MTQTSREMGTHPCEDDSDPRWVHPGYTRGTGGVQRGHRPGSVSTRVRAARGTSDRQHGSHRCMTSSVRRRIRAGTRPHRPADHAGCRLTPTGDKAENRRRDRPECAPRHSGTTRLVPRVAAGAFFGTAWQRAGVQSGGTASCPRGLRRHPPEHGVLGSREERPGIRAGIRGPWRTTATDDASTSERTAGAAAARGAMGTRVEAPGEMHGCTSGAKRACASDDAARCGES